MRRSARTPDLVEIPQPMGRFTDKHVRRKLALKQIIEMYVGEFGFWHDNVIYELLQTRMDTCFRQPLYKSYLIRDMTKTSRDKGLRLSADLDYPDNFVHDKNGYASDRDEILDALGLPKHRISVRTDGVTKPYVVYGDPEVAKRLLQPEAMRVSRDCGSNQTGANLDAILSELNGCGDKVRELLNYTQLLDGYDVVGKVNGLWMEPVPDYWSVPKQEVFFIRFRSEIRLQLHNRIHEATKDKIGLRRDLPHLFKLNIPGLAKVYRRLQL